MSFEREHARAYARTRAEAKDELDEIAPGRMNRTGQLALASAGRVGVHAIFRKAEAGAPGRMTWSSALPAVVMRSAEHAGIDPAAIELVARARRGGMPLEEVLRSRLEAALGARLDGVRVHTGADADAAARALGARAFAIGNDVFFRDGAYDPQQRDGQRLIAHEVAHTVQAHGATTPSEGAATVSHPDDAIEREADTFADAFVQGIGTRKDEPAQPTIAQPTIAQPTIAQPIEQPKLLASHDHAATIHRDDVDGVDPAAEGIDLVAARKANTSAKATHLTEYLQIRLELGMGINVGDPPGDDFAHSLAVWQQAHGVTPPTGKLDDATRKAMAAAGLGSAAWSAKLQQRDREELAEAVHLYSTIAQSGEPQEWNGGQLSAKRYAILQLAASQVGTVSGYSAGKDGKKIGWERLYAYYAAAYDEATAKQTLPYIQKPGKATDDDKAKYPNWSWCGIFLAWVVKSVTGAGSWNQGPVGFGPPRKDFDNLKPGDVANIAGDLNHFCLVTARNGKTLTTINANAYAQQIMYETNNLSQVQAFYSPAGDDATAAPPG
jgi:Domain of unknown function (DUF4157)